MQAHQAQVPQVEAHHEEISIHLPTLFTFLKRWVGENSATAHFLDSIENIFFAFLVATAISVFMFFAMRRPLLLPGRLQNSAEALIEGLTQFFSGILGESGKRYAAFPATLFLYILGMNLIGLVPFMKSSTSVITTTAALAICTFFYVQWIGVTRLGPLGYLDHLAGSPRNIFQWILMPLMLVLHIVGEFAKPFSLAVRLFGNISGEDILIAVLVGMGAMALGGLALPVGIPFHFPFFFLASVFSIVQALVFSMLTTVYIVLMLPHEEHA
jgi:F-type H+-transporting ATPase subunit a